jgi:hypothetical protein
MTAMSAIENFILKSREVGLYTKNVRVAVRR